MTEQSNHPTAGRRRRHRSPAVVPHMHDLPLPLLLDHMGADGDGPSCSEEEKEVKRLRSASTTPRSERGTHPNDYDQVKGVTSVGSRESVKFGRKTVRRRKICQVKLFVIPWILMRLLTIICTMMPTLVLMKFKEDMVVLL